MQIKNKYPTATVFLLIFVVFLAYKYIGNAPKSIKKTASSVSVMTVSKSNIATILESIGTTVSNEAVDIMSNITQTVASVNFSDCQRVKKGQLLVQLNIDKKMAMKKQAEINLLEQQRELNRLSILKKKKIIPEKDYDTQQTKLLDAQAKLDEINAEINESSIVAPFDGILGIRKISVGALVTPGTVITTIDDVEKLKVDFTIPEKYSLLLKPALKISAKSIALQEKKFEGDILAVVPRVSTISRSISVRGTIDNKDYLLRPGMMLKISIRLKDREAIQIPERALSTIGEKHYVFLVSDKKTAVQRFVKIGERKDGFVEITNGLKVNDKIITDGINKLSNNDQVTILKDETNELVQKMKKADSSQIEAAQ